MVLWGTDIWSSDGIVAWICSPLEGLEIRLIHGTGTEHGYGYLSAFSCIQEIVILGILGNHGLLGSGCGMVPSMAYQTLRKQATIRSYLILCLSARPRHRQSS